jgi:hypothetical protein
MYTAYTRSDQNKEFAFLFPNVTITSDIELCSICKMELFNRILYQYNLALMTFAIKISGTNERREDVRAIITIFQLRRDDLDPS